MVVTLREGDGQTEWSLLHREAGQKWALGDDMASRDHRERVYSMIKSWLEPVVG